MEYIKYNTDEYIKNMPEAMRKDLYEAKDAHESDKVFAKWAGVFFVERWERGKVWVESAEEWENELGECMQDDSYGY